MTFVEMGPGPMRLASLKRKVFRRVYFLDISDFGVPDPDLKILDLEQCRDMAAIVGQFPELPASEHIFLFADHCLEHVSKEVLESCLGSISINKFTACFRVPNVLSSAGRGSFLRDPTHRSSFDIAFRVYLHGLGFSISPWVRWYKPLLALKMLMGREGRMNHAEEVVLSIQDLNGSGVK
jgi:hypothetical protein